MSRRSSRGRFSPPYNSAAHRNRAPFRPRRKFSNAQILSSNEFLESITPQKKSWLGRITHLVSPRAFQHLFQHVGSLFGAHQSARVGETEFENHVAGMGFGLTSLLNAMDWENVRAEVDRESRAHVVLIGGVGAGKTTLLYQLKGFVPEPIDSESRKQQFDSFAQEPSEPQIENLGFIAVIDVPAGSPNGSFSIDSAILFELENADVIVWLLDATMGLRMWEYEWLQRIRAMGKTLLVVANKMDAVSDAEPISKWERVLGCEILPISAATGLNVAARLVPRLADVSPQLATALGREVTSWRRDAATRVIQRAAMLSGLTELEPVPILDLPFQIFIQLQMVLRLAAIYGQPLNDRYSREMLATMLSAVALRFAGGQLVKTIPFVGWAASGSLAAAGTWTIGRIGIEYFEHGRSVPLPQIQPPQFWKRRAATAESDVTDVEAAVNDSEETMETNQEPTSPETEGGAT